MYFSPELVPAQEPTVVCCREFVIGRRRFSAARAGAGPGLDRRRSGGHRVTRATGGRSAGQSTNGDSRRLQVRNRNHARQ